MPPPIAAVPPPPRLRVNVQVDRLPDLAPNGAVQIGLRISAAFEPASAPSDPVRPADVDAVLPWKWKSYAQPGSDWNPHDPASWTIWLVNDTAGQRTFYPLMPDSFIAAPVDVDPPAGAGRFLLQAGKCIGALTESAGAAALEAVAPGTPVSGGKVFGFVESLTTLPAPLPAAFKVWTCATIIVPAPFDRANDVFVAAPKFAVDAQSVWAPALGAMPAFDPSGVYTITLEERSGGAGAAVVIGASLPASEIGADGLRIIDLTALSVLDPAQQAGTRDGPFESSDWAHELPRRIAEIVDPGARALAVAHASVHKLLGEQQDDTLSDALRADLLDTSKDFLRKALTALHGPILWPRRRISASSGAPPITFLNAFAQKNADSPDQRDAILALMLAHADDAGPAGTLAEMLNGDEKDICADQPQGSSTQTVRAIGRVPFLALAGAPPEGDRTAAPGTPNADPAIDPASTLLLENADDFVKFAAQHWTTIRPPPDPTTARDIGGLALSWGEDPVAANTWKLAYKAVPLLDLQRFLPASGTTPLTIPLRITWSRGQPTQLWVRLQGAAKPVATAVFTLRNLIAPQDKQPSLACSIDGAAGDGDKTLTAQTDATFSVSLQLVLSRSAAGLSLTVNVADAGVSQRLCTAIVNASAASAGIFLHVSPFDPDQPAANPPHPPTVNMDPPLDGALRDRIAAAIRRDGATALRGALSLAHAGAAIPWLMLGRVPLDGAVGQAALEGLPLRDRLPQVLRLYIPQAFDSLCARAWASAGGASPQILDIFKRICADAAKEAMALADRLIPAACIASDTVASPRTVAGRLAQSGAPSEGAMPLIFTIDQLQAFDGQEDLWTRLAGLGVLIARDNDKWWSLNVATLHAPALLVSNEQRDLLGDRNAVLVRGGTPNWQLGARVDPVPYAVGEIAGVRAATLRYESTSLVAEMESGHHIQRTEGGADARRPEAYLFPTRSPDNTKATDDFPKLPPLTFGRRYSVLPYLVGHGGVLPLPLRSAPDRPTERQAYAAGGSPGIGLFSVPPAAFAAGGAFEKCVRMTFYLRSRAIGAPRLNATGPGVPPGVKAPLALELPIRPAPITLRKDNPARFFLDKSQERGVLRGLDPAAAGAPTRDAIRIEIGEIIGPAAQTLTIAVWQEDTTPGREVLCARVRIPLSGLSGFGLRFEISAAMVATAPQPAMPPCQRLVKLTPGAYAEDEAVEGAVAAVFDPAPPAFSVAWQSAFIELSVDSGALNIEPPRMTYGSVRTAIDAGGHDVIATFTADDDKMILPPEIAHQTRSVHILDAMDGRKTWTPSANLQIRRPAVDVATYDRWINWPLSDPTLGIDANTVRPQLNDAHEAAKGLSRSADRSIDDPAVETFAYEIVRIFPTRAIMQSLRTFQSPDIGAAKDTIQRRCAPGALFLSVAGTPRPQMPASTAVYDQLRGGEIYEVRLYAALSDGQTPLAPAGIAAKDRVVPAVAAGWRDETFEGKTWHLAAPLTLTFEIATTAIPKFYGLDMLRIALSRPPARSSDRAIVKVAPQIIANDITYPAIRYVDRVALMEQRWNWRGRPQPEIPAGQLEHLGYDIAKLDPTHARHALLEKDGQHYLDASFLDREDDDFGEIGEQRLTRAHIFGGRPAIGPASKGEVDITGVPGLFDKELNWLGGANLWRFGLRGTSRYAAMRADDPARETFSHRQRATAAYLWTSVIVPDRDSSRQVLRPGLALALPLTEPMMSGTVPPLLVLFNERMNANFNAADGLEAVIEIARHPFTNNDANVAKYWQEFGPDPIRTAEPGTPLALRMDGPIGYTFDMETGASRFDHSGYLLSPVTQAVRPWSLIKLRFRRAEAPEFLRAADLSPSAVAKAGPTLQGDRWQYGAAISVGQKIVLRLATPFARANLPAIPAPAVGFDTTHEGLAFDLGELPPTGLTTTIDFASADRMDAPRPDGTPPRAPFVAVTATRTKTAQGLDFTVTGATHLGAIKKWTVALKDDAKAAIRIVVSQRPKPPDGDAYYPAGDVSVRVRFSGHSDADALRDDKFNTWLDVTCLPLNTDRTFAAGETVFVRFSDLVAAPGASDVIRPLRLSDFTQGLWCQFGTPMSSFDAIPVTASGQNLPSRNVTIGDLRLESAVIGDLRLDLSVLQASGEPLAESLILSPSGAPDKDSQLEEVLYAVVTRFVYDAFDRLRERPMAILHVGDNARYLLQGETVWTPDNRPLVLPSNSQGRVRFMRVLRGKSKRKLGFVDDGEKDEKTRFDAIFAPSGALQTDTDPIGDQPLDAGGMILGISLPLDWQA